MRGLYLMLAAVFITLMISPAAYSTYCIYPTGETDMIVAYEATNSSDVNSFDVEPVQDRSAEVITVELSEEELKALDTREPKHPYTLGFVGGSFTPTERFKWRL